MTVEPVCIRRVGSPAPFTPKWRASISCSLQNYGIISPIRASHTTGDENKFYKELSLFSLKKKIEDSVLHAEMLAPRALELEEARLTEREAIIHEYNLWDDLTRANEILVKLAESAKVVDSLKDLTDKAEEAKLITELAKMDFINYGLIRHAYTASVDISKFLDGYEMSKLLKEPYDTEGACVTIKSRSEGIYSEQWADQLVQMYMKWAKKYGSGGRVVEKYCSEKGGVKSATIELEFKYAYGYLLGERGIHSMIRRSGNGSVLPEASLAAVDVIPLFLNSIPDLIIDEKDLKISFSSSCREELCQTEPAVLVQHIPTGLSVQSTGERSGFANKVKALDRLKAKLLVILKDQGTSDIASIRKDTFVNIWNQENRRYIFHPNKLVKDVITGTQLPNPSAVLKGNIEPFLAAHINGR